MIICVLKNGSLFYNANMIQQGAEQSITPQQCLFFYCMKKSLFEHMVLFHPPFLIILPIKNAIWGIQHFQTPPKIRFLVIYTITSQ